MVSSKCSACICTSSECVAPPIVMGVWSLAVVLWQKALENCYSMILHDCVKSNGHMASGHAPGCTSSAHA